MSKSDVPKSENDHARRRVFIVTGYTKLADCFGIDLVEAALAKMDKNRLKYPVARNRGRIVKPRRR